MNIDYIVNEQRLNIPPTTLHDKATSTGNGVLLDVSGQDGLIVKITGEFVGTIKLLLQDANDAWSAPTHVYDLENEIRYGYTSQFGITKPGVFLIKNIYGHKTLRARVDRYTSGEITVVACSADSNIVTAGFPERFYIPATLLMDAVEAVGNSEFLSTRLADGVLFNVFGTFDARVKLWGRYGTSAFIQLTSIYDADNPLAPPTSYITKAGRYFVRNINRFDDMQVRIDRYTSGAVSVRASSAKSDDIFDAYAERTKHVLLGSMLGVSVNSGASNASGVIDVSPYAFVYCAIRTSEQHNLEVTVQYQHSGNTLGATVPATTMISGNVYRTDSEWTEVKGTRAVFTVYNKSDSAKTYDVFFYGVR